MTVKKANKRKAAARAQGRARRKPRNNGQSVVAPPTAIGNISNHSHFTMSGMGSTNVVVRGREFLRSVVLQSDQQVLGAAYYLNPALWQGSRLINVARSYEVYRFNRVKLMYIPSTPTTATGSMSIGLETDPNEALPAGGDFYQRSLANRYSTLGPIWSPMAVDYSRPSKDVRWYHCSTIGGTLRDSTQLVAYAVTDSGLAQGAFARKGYLMVEYDVEFMYPELEQVIGAENFSGSTEILTSPVIAAGDPLTADFSNSIGARVIETKLASGVPITGLRAGGSDIVLEPGGSIFWRYVETLGRWVAYLTEEAVRSGVAAEAIVAVAGLAVNALQNRFKARIMSRSFEGS